MIVACTGHKGNVGSRMVKNYGFAPLDADVRDPKQIERAINKVKPDLILHLAAKSGVNWCEAQENQETVQQVNFRGSANLFEFAYKNDIPVVALSSDHIFGGKGLGRYTENASPNPQNFYGLSKFAMESLTLVYPNVRIVRTSTNFWDECPNIKGILADLRARNDIYMPTYMWRSFLHIDHLCYLLLLYCEKLSDSTPKVLNLSGSKVVSWYRFVHDLAHERGLNPNNVHPKWTEDRNHGYAPRAFRAGLNTNLSKKLGYPQYRYLDGIK